LDLAVTFRLNKKAEIEWARSRLKKIQFTERSLLARIGLEIASKRPPSLNRDRLILSCEAFLYDDSFPCASYYKELLKPGTSAGRVRSKSSTGILPVFKGKEKQARIPFYYFWPLGLAAVALYKREIAR